MEKRKSMPIKVKERTNNKILVRCNNPFELQWFMQLMAGMRGKSPITSVQRLDGKEVQLPPPPPVQPTVVTQDSGKPVGVVKPVEIIKPTPQLTLGKPDYVDIPPPGSVEGVGETKEAKKDDKPSTSVDEGKTG
jgi:hypothetical protein